MPASFCSDRGVAAELEGLGPMGLEPVLPPNAMDGGRRQPNLLGQPPPPSPWPIAQAVQTLARVATPPQVDGALGELRPLRKGPDAFVGRAAQHDARSGRQRLRDAPRPQPVLQLGSTRCAYLHPASLYAHAA
jgi:hypothetical protein